MKRGFRTKWTNKGLNHHEEEEIGTSLSSLSLSLPSHLNEINLNSSTFFLTQPPPRVSLKEKIVSKTGMNLQKMVMVGWG